MKFKCPICDKNWRKGQNSIQCSNCKCWVHHNNRLKCSNLSNAEFSSHSSNQKLNWNCAKCDQLFQPFSDLNDNEFLINSNGFNTTISPDVTLILNQDKLKFKADCDNLTASFLDYNGNDDNVSSLDVGIDSSYYDIDEFIKCKPDKTSSFGLLNLNIASINKHIEDLRLILSLLEYNWDVIGISEHKIEKGKAPSVNIDITGDNLLQQQTRTTGT